MQIEGLLRDLGEEIDSGSYTDTIGRRIGTDSAGELAAVPSGGLTSMSTCEPRSGLSLSAFPPPVSDAGDEEDDGGVEAGTSARNALLCDLPAHRMSDDTGGARTLEAASGGARAMWRPGGSAAAAAHSHSHGPKPHKHQSHAAIASVAAKLAAALQPLHGRSPARPHRTAVYELLSSTCESITERSSMQMHREAGARSGFESSLMATAGVAAALDGGPGAAGPGMQEGGVLDDGGHVMDEAMHGDAAGTALEDYDVIVGLDVPGAGAAQQHRIPRRQLLQRLMQQEPQQRPLRQPPSRQELYQHRPFVSGRPAASAAGGGGGAFSGVQPPQRSFLRTPAPAPEAQSSAALSDTSSLAEHSTPLRTRGSRGTGFARVALRLRNKGRAGVQAPRRHTVPPRRNRFTAVSWSGPPRDSEGVCSQV